MLESQSHTARFYFVLMNTKCSLSPGTESEEPAAAHHSSSQIKLRDYQCELRERGGASSEPVNIRELTTSMQLSVIPDWCRRKAALLRNVLIISSAH